ncbi:MAG TPA: helix-turn-helix domain-containing protein [Micromonosporaceae bacterium]
MSRTNDPSFYVTDAEVQSVLAACRVLIAVSARSIPATENMVDPLAFRVMVIIISRGSMSLAELADAAGLNLTTASHLCHRLIEAGLVERDDQPQLTLTSAGRRLVETVTARRRQALELILARLTGPRRLELVTVLREFADAGSARSPAEALVGDL